MKFDISQFVDVLTEQAARENLKNRFRERRKELKITQTSLAAKSGISYGTIRRFESTGDISLSSLLRLAKVIDCLHDFENLFKDEKLTNLKDYKK